MSYENEFKSLRVLTEEIDSKLMEASDVLNALDDIIDGDRRIEPLYKFVCRNVRIAIDDVDKCKELIGKD